MRVAIDATPLLDVRTGVGAFTSELVARLATDSTLEVTAFGYTRIYLDELRARLPHGVATTARPIPARLTRRLWLRWDRPTIERWTGPVDVVHGPNFVVPPSRRGAELTTVHDLTAVRFPELCDDNTRQYPTLIARSLQRGGSIHTPSSFVADEVAEHFSVERERIHVVPNGVDPIPAGDPAAGRRMAGADRYVLALGTVEPRKNLPLLVHAFDALAGDRPGLHLVVAGRAGWGAASLEAAITASPFGPRIRRLGFVSDVARADLLAGAEVLAYPSKYEGFGLPPLEAMAAGTPVVATRAGAIPEVLGPEAALVPVDDVDALAAQLALVVDDPAARAHLTEVGRRIARRYSWAACAAGIVEAYRAVAAA